MSLVPRVSSTVIVSTSRRRVPRLTAANEMRVEFSSVRLPADLVDVGFGGFSLETRCSLRIGAVHQFRFVTPSGRQLELEAKVVHCRRRATHDWSERYITGCEFINDGSPETDQRIEELVE